MSTSATTWTHARRLAAIMVALAAVAIAWTMFEPWHVVHSTTIVDADAFFGAFYLGPDVDLSGAARADMLDHSLGARSWTCTGLSHVGIAAIVATVATALAALAAARWPARPSLVRPTAVTAVLASAQAGIGVAGGTFRHLFDQVDPDLFGARLFSAAAWMLVVAATALLVLALVERRRLRCDARAADLHT